MVATAIALRVSILEGREISGEMRNRTSLIYLLSPATSTNQPATAAAAAAGGGGGGAAAAGGGGAAARCCCCRRLCLTLAA